MTTRIDAGWLIAWDGSQHVAVRDASVLIDGDTIVSVGPRSSEGDDVIDARDQVLAPGFVSLHTHAGGSPFDRSFRDDTESRYLKTGLYEFLMPIRYALTPESVRAAYRASTVELLRSGITTVTEMTASFQAADDVFTEMGIRAYVGPYLRSYNWDVQDRRLQWVPVGEQAEESLFTEVSAFIEDRLEGRVRGFFAPAQVDTCTGDLIQRAARMAREWGTPLQIHAGQSIVEFREMVARTGMTPVQWLDSLGVLDENLTIGHCIFVDSSSYIDYTHADDFALIAQRGATLAHCPHSFAREGVALESAGKVLRHGARLALGVDTTPQSMLAEMRLAAHLSKVVDRDTMSVSAAQLFTAATVAGADALGRPDLGRIAVGCRADLVLYRTDTATMSPLRDPVKSIVYSATESDVDRVLVDGVTLVRDGRVVGADERHIAREMQAAAEQVWRDFDRHTPEGTTAADMAPMSVPVVPAETLQP